VMMLLTIMNVAILLRDDIIIPLYWIKYLASADACSTDESCG